MIREIHFREEARSKILEGVTKIVDAVKGTMGSSGKCVLIGNAIYGNDGLVHLPSIVTKDGYSVTKHFELSDAVQNRGALIIKEAAHKTVEQAGDATTCCCVLAGSIIEKGMKLIDNGANSQELKRGIDSAVEDVVKELKLLSIPVAGDNNRIFQVASVSANNDEVVGKFISDAYAKIGDEGVIDLEASSGIETSIKISDGFKFDKGWISPHFITNKPKDICEFTDAMILLYDKKVTHHTQIQKALEVSIAKNRQLLIVCEDADGEGLAVLAMNNINQRVRVCVVKAPGFGDTRREIMEDMALLTGGQYISDLKGLDIKEVEFEDFGYAKKVVVSKDETVIIGGGGEKSKVEDFLNDLKMNLTQAKTENEKYPIEKRIAKLSGGVAVIQVGASTESELGEKLDRYDDAVRATKAAISEGFVAGGGTVFVRISNKFTLAKVENDFDRGKNIVFESLNAPIKQISDNAGLNVEDIYKEVSAAKGNNGYNLKTRKVENLIEAGIIDSTKALRCALVNASSVAGVALTSDCLIVTTS